MIILGVVLVIGAVLIGIYIVNAECALNSPTGCDKSVVELIGGLMTSDVGALFWAACALGFVLISIGYTLKSQKSKHKQ